MTTEEQNPTSVGTEAELVGEPTAGGLLMPPESYAFPEGAEGVGKLDPGPMGQAFPDPLARVPILGYSKMHNLRTRTFSLVSGQNGPFRLDIQKPTAFVIFANDFAAGDRAIGPVGITPLESPESVGFNVSGQNEYGIPTDRGNFYCWCAGTWYLTIRANSLGAARSLTYLEVPTTSPEIWDRLLANKSNMGANDGFVSTDQAIAAASTEIVDLGIALMANRIEVQNIGGTNSVRLRQNAAAATNSGVSLGPGETYVYEGTNFDTARISAFSAAGTTISVRGWGRF